MATQLWGKVTLHDQFAGIIKQEAGGGSSFTYDAAYMEAKQPPIAHTLPLQAASHYSPHGLPPYFDNLVAEGWLKNAQARALNVSPENRFALLF